MIACLGRRAALGSGLGGAGRALVAARFAQAGDASRTLRGAASIDRWVSRRAMTQHARLHHVVFASVSEPEVVSPEKAQDLVVGGDYTYLDVRTPEEFGAGHAPGAVNYPLLLRKGNEMKENPSFVQQVTEAFPDKGTKLVVACKMGIRGKKACTILAGEGYQNLKDFNEGYDGWVKKGLPLE